MMKKALLLLPLLALLLLAVHVLTPPREKGVAAYVSVETPLYRQPTSEKAFATLPSGARVRWISTTADYAYGYILAEVNGKSVYAYTPWLALNTRKDGSESAQALDFLRTEVGWTAEELEAYGMYTPAYYMRNQFINVEVRSKSHPRWVYYVWLDKLNGGLHDIQSPFTSKMQGVSEKVVRDTLHSGTLTSVQAIRAYFAQCYGPEEGWSAELAEWVKTECARIQ